MIRIERINSPDPGAVSATPILPMAKSLPALPALPARWEPAHRFNPSLTTIRKHKLTIF
jgi:hypothetical protein